MKYKNAQWKINNDENHPRSEFHVILFIAFNPKNQQLTPETANTRYGHYVLCIHKCRFLATSGYIELSLFSVIKNNKKNRLWLADRPPVDVQVVKWK